MATALALVPVFANDPDRLVVESVQKIAAAPRDLLVTDEMRPRYGRFVSDVFGARARALGWAGKPGEDEDTQLLRDTLVPFVANEGDEPGLVAEAKRLAKALIKDRSAVDPRWRRPSSTWPLATATWSSSRSCAPRRRRPPTAASGCASCRRSASSGTRPWSRSR